MPAHDEGAGRVADKAPQELERRFRPLRAWLGVIALAALIAIGVELTGGGTHSSAGTLASNPNLDPGTTLSGRAPNFTLTDQSGRAVTLSSFRGKVVLLAFTDSRCTTICPLTTAAMLDAKTMLGRAAGGLQLLGVDANPKATSIADVRSYSEAHGMIDEWKFLTGSRAQLERVWRAYKIDVAVQQGQIDHTPALFMVDPRGNFSRLYVTQQSYAAVRQLGQLLAQQAARLLADHPRVDSSLSLAQVQGIPPTARVALPRVGGGELEVGPGPRPRLYLFFATWDREVTDLARQLLALNRYQAAAARAGLPLLSAVDEASVEPSASALPSFLRSLPEPLAYPVLSDQSGRIADGYAVQDEPWLVLISADGRFLWYYDVAGLGWLSRSALERKVREALARSSTAPSEAAAQAQLAGSPPALAQIHRQADELLGGEAALAKRIRTLRGYPVVLNVWGSWCAPCRAEFGLLASASARFGRGVAFLGADVNDDSADAHAFLSQHPVSYPSYQMGSDQLTPIVPQGLLGTPTTIFIDREGRIAYLHTGQYDSQGTLDGDISTYALGG